MRITVSHPSSMRTAAAVVVSAVMAAALGGCRRTESGGQARAFATPQAAVLELSQAVKTGDAGEMMMIFGRDAQVLVDTSDPVTARRNQQVFNAAIAERWQLQDDGPDLKTLVVGFEEWPFPIPLVKDGRTWRFDTAAGTEEILARRIGRNELAAIRVCRTYVAAQRRYARQRHDSTLAGTYAATFGSDPGRENGLYWPAGHGRRRSPLGGLLAAAAVDALPRRGSREAPQPFVGYYFRILTAQGPAAAGGARDYVVDGALTRGFALVAWPAQYDATGIMTFLVNQDGVVWERDLGSATDSIARSLLTYDPDSTWAAVR